METAPTIDAMRVTTQRLAPYVFETPSVPFISSYILEEIVDCELFAKLELLQRAGTFKARAAVNNIMALDTQERRITAVSAGNHAVAVAYAAKVLGADAKVVMQASANPYRIAQAKTYGAEILMAKDGKAAFAKVAEIEKSEARVFIHPFEGKRVTEATGGVGLELIQQAGPLDVVIVAVGGGGLASGVAAAVKQLAPECAVYGVEPDGAAAMTLSFQRGQASTLDTVETIADSLAPPMTTPYAYAICKQYLNELVTVSDDQIAAAARIMFSDLKLAVEPAGAAALAGALGPLKQKIRGKRVGIIVCGANIDWDSFAPLMERGGSALNRNIFAS